MPMMYIPKAVCATCNAPVSLRRIMYGNRRVLEGSCHGATTEVEFSLDRDATVRLFEPVVAVSASIPDTPHPM